MGDGGSAGLGRAIREAREKAGLTLRKLAERIGVSAPYLSDVERGRRGIPKLPELARICGVTVDSLVSRSETLTRTEVEWINAHPEIVAMLRRFRRRDDRPPGPPRACRSPRKKGET